MCCRWDAWTGALRDWLIEVRSYCTTIKSGAFSTKLDGDQVQSTLTSSVPFKPGVCVLYLASEVQHFQALHGRPGEVPFTNLGMYTPLRFTQNVVKSVERARHHEPLVEEPVDEEWPGAELPEPQTYCHCGKPWDSSGLSRYSFMIQCQKCQEWYHGSCVGSPDSNHPPSRGG